MKKIILVISVLAYCVNCYAQKLPCSGSVYRQFDFWIGEWEAFSPAGKKAGDSRISSILDSCIILEEWTSAAAVNGLVYSGKSFNTYNAATNQWQQTWVDNVGGSNEYLKGRFENNSIIFQTTPFNFKKDSVAVRRLTFFNSGKDKVRQLGEISKDNEATWAIEYDLEYRRKK